MSAHPYNPLAIENLGKSITEALLEQPLSALPPASFVGAGVYVIYYRGSHPLYQREATEHIPIYVGKAVAKGARKGLITVTGKTESRALYDRLSEHADSITVGADLDLAEFSCRYLTVDAIWIPLGESLLINMFSPIWNVKVEGFGNHDPGGGRSKQKKSWWDVLHPGRAWVAKLTGVSLTYEEVVEKLTNPKVKASKKSSRSTRKKSSNDDDTPEA